MKNLDKKIILLIMIIASIFTIGSTYAFMSAYISSLASTSVEVNSGITESLSFAQGDQISINVKASNFGEGVGNLSDETRLTAKLVKDSTKVSATQSYNLYFDIIKNNFEYTHNITTPELVLTIIDPNGNAITSLTDLRYVTVTDAKTNESISGFDVTEHEGLIKITEDKEISTTENFVTQDWILKLTFVNLSTDQYLNKGKEFESNTVISSDKLQYKMVSGAEFNNSIGSLRSEIDEVHFHDTKSGNYETATTKWDFSELDNSEEVIGYIEEKNGKQVLHIEAENRIEMPQNMGGSCVTSNDNYDALFCGFTSVTNYEFNNVVDTSNVEDLHNVFALNKSLLSLDISSFDTSNVKYMVGTFSGLEKIEHLDLSTLNTSKVVDMNHIFNGNYSMKTIDISSFDTSNVKNMYAMFANLTSLTALDVSHFNTSEVTSMQQMFYNTAIIENLDLSNFDTKNVTNMTGMFQYSRNLRNLNIDNFDTSKVTNMSYMFGSANSLTSIDVSSFDTSNVITMNRMFTECTSLSSIDVSNFITTSLEDFQDMFSYNDVITSIDLSSFDTSNVKVIRGLFFECDNLTHINISNFDLTNANSYDLMFTKNQISGNIYVKNQITVDKLSETQTHKPSGATFVVKP